MKLKCTPEDFVVSELSSRRPTGGPFSLYRLNKRSIGTMEALQTVQRSWNLSPRQLSHAGLKDRHAVTSQLVTIRNGPKAPFDRDHFQLEHLGQTDSPIEAADIDGNRFEIVLRSLSADETERIRSRWGHVAARGFPNYFDEQRFGSLGPSLEFVAAKWCLKDYERALWLALAEHNRHDDATERGQKQILRDLWNNWAECKQQLDRSHRRSVVTYLVDHPANFRKAFALLNEGLRGIYLSAFQSAVWNRMAAECLCTTEDDDAAGRLQIGDASLPIMIDSKSESSGIAELPLPSARCKGITPELRNLCDRSLVPYGLNLSEMKLSFPRDRWFSRGDRATRIVPLDLHVTEADDDRYPNRRKATLIFDLPRGCYATMLVKTLTSTTTDSNTEDVSDDAATDEFT